MRTVVAACVALLAGCFEPGLPSDVRCADGLCPAGLVCDQGFCRATRLPDAGLSDAQDAAIDAERCLDARFREGENGYVGTQDTRLREANPNLPGDLNEVDWDDGAGGGISIGLLRFDGVFGDQSGQVPTRATIESAVLTIEIVDASEAPPGAIHDVAVVWDEDTTFNTFGAQPGVDPDEIGELVGEAPFELGTATVDVTSSMRRVQEVGGNGWIFIPASGNVNGAAFASSEEQPIAVRPELAIRYCP